jgi:peptidoglycan/xylan/chitin deacetylase (PgdA/CDA1 family)
MTDNISSLKRIIKRSVVTSGVLRIAKNFVDPSITVLRYHSIQEDQKQNDALINTSIVHSLSLFAKQMEIVASRYTPVSMDEILSLLEHGKSFPENAVAVTFDDGFTDNFSVAGPVLRRFSIPATFYITVNSIVSRDLPWFCRIRHAFETTRKKSFFDATDGVARSMVSSEGSYAVFRVVANRCAALSRTKLADYVKVIENELEVVSPIVPDLMMNWEQIKSLHNDGHIIGSHTMTHPNVAHIEPDEQEWELNESKRILESELGVDCNHFSYPHPTLTPHWTDRTIIETKRAGYKMATTTTYGMVRKGDDPLAIKRVAVSKDMDEFLFNLAFATYRK